MNCILRSGVVVVVLSILLQFCNKKANLNLSYMCLRTILKELHEITTVKKLDRFVSSGDCSVFCNDTRKKKLEEMMNS